MEVKSYFCGVTWPNTKPFKYITLYGDPIDYKGFQIFSQASSSMLVLRGEVVTETVSSIGCKRLADKIIRSGRVEDSPESIAKDWAFTILH